VIEVPDHVYVFCAYRLYFADKDIYIIRYFYHKIEIIRLLFFHSCTVYLDIIKVFYLPTDAQVFCFKRNIKIYVKTTPTCFGLITIVRECTIRALLKLLLLKQSLRIIS